MPKGRRKEFMNRKKVIRIILAALAVAALLAAGGYALWKNGFFEKINSVEALREVIAGAGVWAGASVFRAANDDGHRRADSQQHFDDGGRAGAGLLAGDDFGRAGGDRRGL